MPAQTRHPATSPSQGGKAVSQPASTISPPRVADDQDLLGNAAINDRLADATGVGTPGNTQAHPRSSARSRRTAGRNRGTSSFRKNPGVLHEYVLGLHLLGSGGKFEQVRLGWIAEYDSCTATAFNARANIDSDPTLALGQWQASRPVYQRLLREYGALKGHQRSALRRARRAFVTIDARFIAGRFRKEMAAQPGSGIDEPQNTAAQKLRALLLIEAAKKAHAEIQKAQSDLARKIASTGHTLGQNQASASKALSTGRQATGTALKALAVAEAAVKAGDYAKAIAALKKHSNVGQAMGATDLASQVATHVGTSLQLATQVTGHAFQLAQRAETAKSFIDASGHIGKAIGGPATALAAIYHTYKLVQGIRSGDPTGIATAAHGLGQAAAGLIGMSTGGAVVGAGLGAFLHLALQTFMAWGQLGGILRSAKKKRRLREVDALVRKSVPMARHFDRARRAYQTTWQAGRWGLTWGGKARAEKMGLGTARLEGQQTLALLVDIANLARSATIDKLDKRSGGKLARGLNQVPRTFQPHAIYSLEVAVRLVVEGIQAIADQSAMDEGIVSKTEIVNIRKTR